MLVRLGGEQGEIGEDADAHEDTGIEQVGAEIKMQRNTDVPHLMVITVDQNMRKGRRKQKREVGDDVGDAIGANEAEPTLGAVGFSGGRLLGKGV